MKCVVLKAFRDIETNETYMPGVELDLADSRVEFASEMGYVEVKKKLEIKPKKTVRKTKKSEDK